ncbi:matrixin family metalloprotease [Nocardioides sp. 503]|uniref:matrixin family metalloprotease n=1 Tax=Nocardioides sp. 503 TaxID=2508326 RepID=UPI0014321289|nr:matrixin family metalloprotease [Nocardioides sp. 503]
MGDSGWSRRRAERQWQRDLLREIRAMETTDEGPDGGTVTPIRGGLPRAARPSRRARHAPPGPAPLAHERRRTLLTVLVTLGVIGALVVLNLGPGSAQVRQWLGFDDRFGTQVEGDGSGSYEFLATRPGTDEPVGWSHCEPIPYVVNTDGAPDDWEDLVRDATDRMQEASGLVFEDRGTTDDRDFEGRFGLAGGAEPVLIAWADEDEVPGLSGDVAGLAGPMSRNDGMFQKYVTGRVVLDKEAFEEIESVRGGDEQREAIVLHELGHLVGLAHVDDPGELMHPTTETTELGPGDRSGLAILGDAPC